ncbi:hypothetical protein [uncultured Carboxylicivirga sp.]
MRSIKLIVYASIWN